MFNKKIIDEQLDTSLSDTFAKIIGQPLVQPTYQLNLLKASWLDTPLGPMVAIANDSAVYLLDFVDRQGLARKVERLRHHTKSAISPGKTNAILSIEKELQAYFEGILRVFTTPLCLLGSPFQKRVWDGLCQISYGKTKSYKEQAEFIAHPTACRAVANANGANQIAIVVPCHRIITSAGTLGGYGGGIARKKWLIEHEKQHCDIEI